MYTEVNATRIKDWVRKFFDGGDQHIGVKSDNKRYDAPPDEGITLKEGQADRRNVNQAKAAEVRGLIHKTRQEHSLSVPADVGEMIVKQKLRGGNCSEMTWVCSYGFKDKAHVWVVIIQDPGDHQFCILAKDQPAHKSISKMDYMGDDQWIIDPWANIVCKPGEFAEKFKAKMKKWSERGKRIGVPTKVEGTMTYKFTPGIDPGYLANILDSGLVYRKGWSF